MNAEDLKSILIKTGLFLAAVFLGVFVAPEEPFLVIGICLGFFVLIALGRFGRGLWVIFPLSSGFSGAINLIPGGMTPIQISSLVLVFMCLYLLKADASFRIRFGPGWFFWPLLLLNLILIYKWIRTGDLGLNILGSKLVGGKGYLQCSLPFLGYVAAISMFQPGKLKPWKIPLFVMAGYFFDTLVFGISSFFPFTARHIFRFYDAVNIEAFQALEVSQTAALSEGFMVRFHQCGHFAYVLLAALQVYLPYKRWWGIPNILIGPIVLLISFFLSVVSGFRNFLVRYAVVGAIGVWQSFGLFSVFLTLPIIASVFLLCAGQGSLFQLPKVVQRTLVFLPGDWDPAIKKSAGESAEFRKDLRRVYFSEFFKPDNFLGEGFLYNRGDLEYSQETYWKRVGYTRQMEEDDTYRGFITRRAHHEGILNIHHLTGHVGTLIWLVFGALSLFSCGRFLARVPLSQSSLTAHFGATLIVVTVLTYWFLFGSLKEMVPSICAFAFCFYAGLKDYFFASQIPLDNEFTLNPVPQEHAHRLDISRA
jgi:hypothetical protein